MFVEAALRGRRCVELGNASIPHLSTSGRLLNAASSDLSEQRIVLQNLVSNFLPSLRSTKHDLNDLAPSSELSRLNRVNSVAHVGGLDLILDRIPEFTRLPPHK